MTSGGFSVMIWLRRSSRVMFMAQPARAVLMMDARQTNITEQK
jgi:hypothetical protein